MGSKIRFSAWFLALSFMQTQIVEFYATQPSPMGEPASAENYPTMTLESETMNCFQDK